jgi:hypothetical protein
MKEGREGGFKILYLGENEWYNCKTFSLAMANCIDAKMNEEVNTNQLYGWIELESF